MRWILVDSCGIVDKIYTMSIDKDNKLPKLYEFWPANVVITMLALRAKGFSDQLVQRYCHSGWLKRIGRGAFVRRNERALWQGGLFAVQHDLKKTIHVGGLTALALKGVSHYLGASVNESVYLYNTTELKIKLPCWFMSFTKTTEFHYHQAHLFDEELGLDRQNIDGLELVVSEPERAILELLYLVPSDFSVEHAANLVENLQTIRPDLMQTLLVSCRHILVKRLFLFLADAAQLPVMRHLKMDNIDLGSGHRIVNPGGKYYANYQLTVDYGQTSDYEDEIDV